MTDDRWQQLVQALNLTDATGAAFGLTPEETDAHRQAFRAAATVGGDAFLLAVEHETRAAERGSALPVSSLSEEESDSGPKVHRDLTTAERLRLEARQTVAAEIEAYFEWEMLNALAHFEGTKH